jgi:DNA-directed RNA polymerase subunit RPC12/RpoP
MNCGNCWKCVDEASMSSPWRIEALVSMRYILCPVCGNKRCPKATDHELECTGSNESGQPGSVYTGG